MRLCARQSCRTCAAPKRACPGPAVHEASAVEAIIATALDEVASRGISGIRRIDLVVGEATGYMLESLDFYFRTMTKGGPLEGTSLGVRYIKPLLRCASCGGSFERVRFSFSCPRCGGEGIMTPVGTEFYIEAMDVDSASGPEPPASSRAEADGKTP